MGTTKSSKLNIWPYYAKLLQQNTRLVNCDLNPDWIGTMQTKNQLNRLIAVVTILTLAASASASTVVPMNINTMADHTGQAFIATVQSVDSYWADSPKRIESKVTFQNVNYIKGEPAKENSGNATFSLTVPGGTIDNLQMHICGTPRFSPGDKYLLLLLPTYKTFPVVGMHQGAFLITADSDGIERVSYNDGTSSQLITAVDGSGFIQTVSSQTGSVHDNLVRADGLSISQPQDLEATALTLDQLLDRLQPALDSSRDYKLTRAAGQHLLSDQTPVPLKPSSNTDSSDNRPNQQVTRAANRAKESDDSSRTRRAD